MYLFYYLLFEFRNVDDWSLIFNIFKFIILDYIRFKLCKNINMLYFNIFYVNEYILSYILFFKSSCYRDWGKCELIILLI